jgi:hypothetical protein
VWTLAVANSTEDILTELFQVGGEHGLGGFFDELPILLDQFLEVLLVARELAVTKGEILAHVTVVAALTGRRISWMAGIKVRLAVLRRMSHVMASQLSHCSSGNSNLASSIYFWETCATRH